MASIRTHNNRRRSKMRTPRQRQRDLAATYVRQYRRQFKAMRKWFKNVGGAFTGAAAAMGELGGAMRAITGRIPRDPEPQYFIPHKHGLNVNEAVMPMGLMIDYSDVERRMVYHMSAQRLGAIIVDAPSEADVLNTLARKRDIHTELSEALKVPRAELKENTMGLLYGMSPEKAAQNKVKKNG